MLRGVMQPYNKLLFAHPVKTKAVGTGVTYLFSDMTAQAIETQRPGAPTVAPQDRAARALKFGAIGALWIGPVLSSWFNLMDRFVPGSSRRAILVKLIADQLLMAPPLLGSMFCVTALSNGSSLCMIEEKLRLRLLPTWGNSLVVWAPVSLLQQAMVPLHYRVAVSNLVSYFWDTYLSLIMMDSPAPPAEAGLQCHNAEPSQSMGGLVRRRTIV